MHQDQTLKQLQNVEQHSVSKHGINRVEVVNLIAEFLRGGETHNEVKSSDNAQRKKIRNVCDSSEDFEEGSYEGDASEICEMDEESRNVYLGG